MGFLGVYKAVYDYQPQGEGELELREGDLLYLLEKSVEDDWWKAKKKAERDDEDEPEGLVPNNYVEEVSYTVVGRSMAKGSGTSSLSESLGALFGCLVMPIIALQRTLFDDEMMDVLTGHSFKFIGPRDQPCKGIVRLYAPDRRRSLIL
jgi:hypothetical protein